MFEKVGDKEFVYRDEDQQKKTPLFEVELTNVSNGTPEPYVEGERIYTCQFMARRVVLEKDFKPYDFMSFYIKWDGCFDVNFLDEVQYIPYGGDGNFHFCSIDTWRDINATIEAVVKIGRQLVDCDESD